MKVASKHIVLDIDKLHQPKVGRASGKTTYDIVTFIQSILVNGESEDEEIRNADSYFVKSKHPIHILQIFPLFDGMFGVDIKSTGNQEIQITDGDRKISVNVLKNTSKLFGIKDFQIYEID